MEGLTFLSKMVYLGGGLDLELGVNSPSPHLFLGTTMQYKGYQSVKEQHNEPITVTAALRFIL